MMKRQIEKAQKYCPGAEVGNLVDISSLRKDLKDSAFHQIADNFKKTRQEIKFFNTN